MKKAADVVSRVLWILTIAGAGFAGWGFWSVYQERVLFRQSPDVSAPQMAALAGETLVWAVVPYVLARAFDGATRSRRPIEP